MPRDYWWYDSEDGEDIWKKLNFANKLAAITSFPVVAMSTFLHDPRTTAEVLLKFGSISLPAIGMASMFTLTSQLLCKNFPQLGRKGSYAAGGFAAGSIVGTVMKSPRAGCYAGFYLAIAAIFIPMAHEEKWSNQFDVDNSFKAKAWGDSETSHTDWSLVKKKDLPPPMQNPFF